MLHAPIRTAQTWHAADCDCPTCEPYVPSRPRPMSLHDISVWMLAGIVNGLILSWLLDRLIDGPGILAMVGR